MNKGNDWISPYKRKKFLKSHNKKSFYKESYFDKRDKVIAILLDVQKTLDEINDEKAKIFMHQLHSLRIKFQASKVLINVSSHMCSPESLNKYLKVLNRNLIPNIILDDATYFFGTYNYETGELNEKGYDYNRNKIKTFEDNYFRKYNVVWFAVIDDSVSESYIKEFKNYHPMIACKPSIRFEEDLKYNNFMFYSTKTYGFDGVLECVDTYLKNIKQFRKEEIVEKQKDILEHLSAYEVQMMCIKKEFSLLERYLKADALDREDYSLVARELTYHIEKGIDFNELKQVERIIELLKLYIDEANEIFTLKLEK